MRLPATAMGASGRSCEQEENCAEVKNNALFFVYFTHVRKFNNI
jgi:hypothetical protein